MFVRKKKNASGKVSIQVIDKRSGKYSVIKTIGCSDDPVEISVLFQQAKKWINDKTGVVELDFANEEKLFQQMFDSIDRLELVGLELLLGRIFDEIGFNKIEDKIFRQLVIYRVAFPQSKLKTTEYLYRYQHIDWHEDMLYRYLDKLHKKQKDIVQQISYEHTLRILGNDISVVFYNVTTLYFEIDEGDDLRKTGFSKEGKHQNPQIVLGLLVSKGGYPLVYDIFEGSQFEGHTLLPVINSFKEKYKLDKLIVVADSGLMSAKNIEQLIESHYEFIIGARIKNENRQIREQILSLQLKNGQSSVINKGDLRLIITYSDSRAKKDAYNREKGIKKLEKKIKKGKLTKASINNRGYNKFLEMEGDVSLSLNAEKIQTDQLWDGLKGYITNTNLANDRIIENYRHLWQIEKAFRITKSDLRVRPVYHRLPDRIEAHICISFVAYKVYKELERKLKELEANISVSRALEIAENIFEIQIESPITKKKVRKPLLLTQEQKDLAKLFNF
jgi:transposase